MSDFFVHYAGLIGLIFFFTVFVGIAIWAYRPSAKQYFESLKYIPLSEDNHDK